MELASDTTDPAAEADPLAAARHPTAEELAAGVDHVRESPADVGTLELIVRRPAVDAREELEEAELDLRVGLVGDTWDVRASRRTADGSPHPGMQLTLMNARAAALVATTPERRALAGDQLYVDFDLGVANLPAGTHVAIGDAVVEVSEMPHTGCAKFTQRFGLAAHRWVNSEVGDELRLRGVNTMVVTPGTIRRGDPVRALRSVCPE